MATALEKLRDSINDLNNQDTPLESIKDVFNELLDRAETETMNGGSPPYFKNAAYDGYGAAITVPNTDEPGLPWIIAPSARYPDYLPSDDPTLLNLADPTIPVFTEAGVYAITSTIYCTTKVAGKLVRATLQADSADYNTTYGWAVNYFDLTGHGGPPQDLPAVTFHLTPRYLPAGSIVYAGVSNFTGGTLDFFMTSFVQKVA